MDINKIINFQIFLEQDMGLSSEKAFEIIYYLQEKMDILPSNYELCQSCGCIYDSDSEGVWDKETGGLCGFCCS